MNEVEKFTKYLKDTDVVLVQFYATWYHPSVELQHVFEKIQHDYKGKINYIGLDVDKEIELTEKYQINTSPTTMVFNKGERVYVKAGNISYKEITEVLLEYLA